MVMVIQHVTPPPIPPTPTPWQKPPPPSRKPCAYSVGVIGTCVAVAFPERAVAPRHTTSWQCHHDARDVQDDRKEGEASDILVVCRVWVRQVLRDHVDLGALGRQDKMGRYGRTQGGGEGAGHL